MLSDGQKNRLVVGSGVDRGHLVDTRRESIGNVSCENSVDSSCVEALEEREPAWIGGSGLGKRIELFDDDVGVAPDLALRVQLLRRGEVVQLRVHKVTGLESGDGDGDGERLVGSDGATVERERELGRGHVVDGWDETHRCCIAGTSCDLLAIGLWQIAGRAEVDEVVS